MADLSKTKRPPGLPQWERPPLDEVAIAVQFKELTAFKAVHFGLLSETFRSQALVHCEDQNPIEPRFEVFGKLSAGEPQIQFQTGRLPLPRVWYISEDRHKLAQVQSDRFIYNWRRVEGVGEYPRFDTVLPAFCDHYLGFQEFLKTQRLGSLEVNQCELSYFNDIEVDDAESFADAFARVFRIWNVAVRASPTTKGTLLPEVMNFSYAHIVSSSDNTPVARVHVQAIPAIRGKKRIIRLILIFRGPWSGADETAMLQFFALGREAIVSVFDALISEKCHDAWGRHVGYTNGGSS